MAQNTNKLNNNANILHTMKPFYFAIISLMIVSCGLKNETIEEKAIRLVKEHYPDCERIVHVSTDTITLGNNLAYRMKQQEQSISFAKMYVDDYRYWADEYERNPYSQSYAKEYREKQRDAEEKLQFEEGWLAALDSLRSATLDIADTPAAYTVWVQYNYVGNFVWVQLSANGDLLVITKNNRNLLLNPGGDMPGYYDLYCKYHGL